MQTIIVDSWAILAFLHKEKGHKQIEKIFKSAARCKIKLFVSIINIGEVYYKLIRSVGRQEAIQTVQSLNKIPIQTISATDELVLKAAEIKAEHPIAFGDCFAVSIALEKKGAILTGDPEFKRVERIVKIKWL